jgi:aconitate hydratase
MSNSYGARGEFVCGDQSYGIYRLAAVAERHDISHLPFSLKILLENLLRHEDGENITGTEIEALANWDPKATPTQEISFTPGRVLLQDFTGVPAVVDLATMRDALHDLGGDPDKINPLSPAELVIDHSVQVDVYGKANALDLNAEIEFKRNQERYEFLRWGQQAFDNFRVVPPDTGIVHQVNLEFLARGVMQQDIDGQTVAFPDTVVGTDSHTTMINGLGVLGWGVGGIEAEAGMLGQPITMLIPQVVGVRLTGALSEGSTATDLVLRVVEVLREHGVVGKFVEFFGEGLDQLSLADRATVANMAPEYGATCGIFPIDDETLNYLRLSGRSDQQVALVETYMREQGMFREPGQAEASYSDVIDVDVSAIEPAMAGPKRPQDRISLKNMQSAFQTSLKDMIKDRKDGGSAEVYGTTLTDGLLAIAAITSCTNTSNPSVMLAAGLLAKNAVDKGLRSQPWVKTSLGPGSLVVTDYLKDAGLLDSLETLGFGVVGYGCTTCIGNSGPLPERVSAAIADADLVASSVLSGNRNFEGRIHSEVKMNFLASPPLVVAYALAGTVDTDIINDALGNDLDGRPVYLKDIWPSSKEVADAVTANVTSAMFRSTYATVFDGDKRWQGLNITEGNRFAWVDDSTYIKRPTFFDGMTMQPPGITPINGARVLARLGDSITTDHISPAGAIQADSPAGQYLQDNGVAAIDFNSYGSRRGNHEVMMRGTFANIRLRNLMAPGTEGGMTTHQPSGEVTTIYDAAIQYAADAIPLVILAGKEYGCGSSRDWAAKGTRLLGVKAVIVETYERIHRSNLVGMGVLPLEFVDGANADSLGLDGSETFDFDGLETGAKTVNVTATKTDGSSSSFSARVRIDTPKEWEYFENGGILHYVLRNLAK